MMGVNPFYYVLLPRMYASIIALPILTAVFNLAGLIGGFVTCIYMLHMDISTFWYFTSSPVTINDIANCFIKSGCFSIVVAWISLYQGYFLLSNFFRC